METTPRVRRDRRRRRRLLAFLLSATAVGTLTSTALSLALFTATDTIAANTFSAGAISIDASLPAPQTSLTTTGMMPGDSVTGTITVTNTGNQDLKYKMVSTFVSETVPNFSDQFSIVVREEDAAGGCAAFTGAVVPLTSNALDGAAYVNWRLLTAVAPGDSEVVCVRVTFDIAASDPAFQGASTTVDLVFNAEQYKNNTAL